MFYVLSVGILWSHVFAFAHIVVNEINVNAHYLMLLLVVEIMQPSY